MFRCATWWNVTAPSFRDQPKKVEMSRCLNCSKTGFCLTDNVLESKHFHEKKLEMFEVKTFAIFHFPKLIPEVFVPKLTF